MLLALTGRCEDAFSFFTFFMLAIFGKNIVWRRFRAGLQTLGILLNVFDPRPTSINL